MQKEKISKISVPVKYELMPFEDDRFKRCKILVMHDGLNLNGSVFNMDAIESAKESLKNIPILGFIRQNDGTDEADFGGHESEVILSDDGIKFRYLGRPIGVIPADANDYHYEIYDDKTFVAVTGYIWTDYANEALDILQASGEKGQSMEIRIDDGDWDLNDNFVISKYRYTGLTILGDNVTPAMTGAKVQLFSVDNSTFSEEYFAMVDELNVALKNYASQSKESEVLDMEEEKKIEEIENPEEKEIVGETNSIEGEEPKAEEEMSTKGEEEGKKEIPENIEKNSIEEGKETPEETPIDYSAQILELNTQLSNLQTAYSTLEQEIIELREFKRIRIAEDTKAEKEAVFSEFSVGLTDEEMKSVKDDIDNLTVEKITEKLNAIFTAKNLAQLKAKKFSNDAPKGGVAIEIPKKESPKSRYAV